MNKTIAIIGAGASGLMCAISAKRRLLELSKNAHVIVIEKNSRIGKKLLSTGNGKCNLTNTNEHIDKYHSNDINKLHHVLNVFDAPSIISFFEQLGVTCVTSDTLVYPRSMQASSVLDALRFEAQRLGVKFICDFDVKTITKRDCLYIISNSTQEFYANTVIIASGSSAGGGSDSGLSVLKSFGHKIYTPYPALSGLKCDADVIKTAKGMRSDVSLTLICDKKTVRTEIGELLFCDYGFSGIAIMQLSGHVARLFGDGKKHDILLKIDFAREYTFDELYSFLLKRKEALSHLELENFLCGFLNKRVAMTIIKHANLGSFSDSVSTLDTVKLKKLTHTIKSFDASISGVKGGAAAQAMGGGAALSDFHINTLESKKSPSLFACGEVLDVYGDCGGYNLTWAWASGFVCGNSAANNV